MIKLIIGERIIISELCETRELSNANNISLPKIILSNSKNISSTLPQKVCRQKPPQSFVWQL